MADFRLTMHASAVQSAVHAAVVEGLALATLDVGDRSARRAPKDQGDLRQSMHHIVDGVEVRGEVRYTADYSVIQHEDLTAKHRDGEAKFLEREIHENAQTNRAGVIIANRLRQVVGP